MTIKKKVSFVNPNFQQGPREFNAYYLPYSPGIIWSYAYQFDEIKEKYELGEFIWRRDPIEEVVELLKDNDIVGFSTYVWNRSYNNVLARELKKANPDILVIFGGPEPPIEDPEFFKRFPYIDLCVKKEGEIAFKNVLSAASQDDLKNIPGLLINDAGTVIDTGDSPRIDNLDSIPSPYLTGLFSKLMKEYPEVRWNVTLETNRGCPYQCTFCDWGSLTYNKIKKFGLTRVFHELEWIGQNGCDFVSITDANFGIFEERDSLIADKLIEVQLKYNNPKSYAFSWAKNQKKEVVNIVKKLITKGNGAKLGLNLSVQTLDENVLDIIKRKNLETHKIKEVFDLCEANNIPLYTELILGLPGETLSSWKNNFYKLYEVGNHTGISIYQAQLLENAEMNLSQKKFYKIEGSIVYDYLIGTYNEYEVQEGIEVVISTRDMPREKMLDAQVFSWLQNTFHINGLTNYISRFLFKYKGVSYETFYNGLYDYIQNDLWLTDEISRIRIHYDKWALEGRIGHTPIEGMEIHGWNLIHSTMITMHSQDKRDHVFNIIESYVKQTFDLEKHLFDQLMLLQKNYIIDHKEIANMPKVINFDYDLIGYIHDDRDLNSPASFEFEFPEDKDMTMQRFCESIFYARRRNFGKAWVTRI
jgi:tRNA A37 methylthiotransferase MiaB